MRSSPMSTRCAGRTCAGWLRTSSCPTGWRSRRLAHLASSRGSEERSRKRWAPGRRVPVVIGATGLGAESLASLRDRCEAEQVGAILAPNFALGAVLMMEFARRAARYFPHVEIIELHHDRKRDAPSGTAARTARLVAAARGTPPPPAVEETVEAAGARGASTAGVPVHSV